MGWVFGAKPNNIGEWLHKIYSRETNDTKQICLDYAMVNMSEIYIAVEQTDKYGIKTITAEIMSIKFANEREDGFVYHKWVTTYMENNAEFTRPAVPSEFWMS
jgi:hypothetical protein